MNLFKLLPINLGKVGGGFFEFDEVLPRHFHSCNFDMVRKSHSCVLRLRGWGWVLCFHLRRLMAILIRIDLIVTLLLIGVFGDAVVWEPTIILLGNVSLDPVNWSRLALLMLDMVG